MGLIAGLKALKEGVGSAILDIGLARPTKGSRVFAALKGARDAGIAIPCDSDVLPELSRIEGGKISEYAQGMDDPMKYERIFSGYLKRGLRPQDLPDHFKAVKARIKESHIG